MFKEIGSNFWLKPEELAMREKTDWHHDFVKRGEHSIYTSSGRGAISLLLEQMDPVRRVALLPLYTCASVIMPFLNKGYEIHFFDLDTGLVTPEQEFMAALEKSNPGIVFLHAYFGFDTLRNLRPHYSRLRERGIVVIEDVTHSLFSDFSKAGADFYAASLRKWFALPDGGVAISPGKRIRAKKRTIHEELVRVNLAAIRMKNEYTGSLDGRLKAEYRKLFYSTEELLNHDCGVYAMSGVARAILSRTDLPALIATRRDNFGYLLDNLPRNPILTPVFTDLPEGVAPLYFPVYVKQNRARLRAFLAEDEIYAPVHWEIPPSCAGHLTDAAAHIYHHILSIPCDQRYANNDMERILRRLSAYKE